MTVLVKGYYGLGGNLAVLLCGLRLAEKLGRPLSVDWRNSVYGSTESNLFPSLFESPAPNLSLPEKVPSKVWPPEWRGLLGEARPHIKGLSLHLSMASEAEKLSHDSLKDFEYLVVSRDDPTWFDPDYTQIYRRLWAQLSPSPKVRTAVENFKKHHFAEEMIGVHFRHGNGERTVVPPDIAWFFERVDDAVAKEPEAKLFLATDCRAVLDEFSKRYGARVVSLPKNYLPVGHGAFHTSSDASQGSNRDWRAVEALIDLTLLSETNRLIGSRSFFTGVAVKVSGTLSPQRVSAWVPKVREFYPPATFRTVMDYPPILKRLEAAELTADGLFVEERESLSVLHYLAWEISSFRSPAELDLAKVKKSVVARRLY